jgi:hypothetical protein
VLHPMSEIFNYYTRGVYFTGAVLYCVVCYRPWDSDAPFENTSAAATRRTGTGELKSKGCTVQVFQASSETLRSFGSLVAHICHVLKRIFVL